MRDAWAAQRKDYWKHAALALLVPALLASAVLQNQARVSEAGVKLAENGRMLGSRVASYVASNLGSPAQAATPEASDAP